MTIFYINIWVRILMLNYRKYNICIDGTFYESIFLRSLILFYDESKKKKKWFVIICKLKLLNYLWLLIVIIFKAGQVND